MGAIAGWWRHLWETGQTWRLNEQVSFQVVKFNTYETKGMGEALQQYEQMTVPIFLWIPTWSGRRRCDVLPITSLTMWVSSVGDELCLELGPSAGGSGGEGKVDLITMTPIDSVRLHTFTTSRRWTVVLPHFFVERVMS